MSYSRNLFFKRYFIVVKYLLPGKCGKNDHHPSFFLAANQLPRIFHCQTCFVNSSRDLDKHSGRLFAFLVLLPTYWKVFRVWPFVRFEHKSFLCSLFTNDLYTL